MSIVSRSPRRDHRRMFDARQLISGALANQSAEVAGTASTAQLAGSGNVMLDPELGLSTLLGPEETDRLNRAAASVWWPCC
ncbi:hypothetical protein HerbRD11066_78530 [Herbidospora sp. RD11066]